MKLNVALLKQDPKSDDCLRACMWMVLNFLGDPITKDEVWETLTVYKKGSGLYGAYYSDVGKIVIKRGLKASITHGDWTWWNKECVSAKNSKSLIKAIQGLKKNTQDKGDKILFQKEIDFIKAGGKYNFKLPSLETIDSNIKKRIPVIVSLNGAILDENPKHNFSHAIVVTGKKGKNYLINNPSADIKKIDENNFLYAWSMLGGWALVVESSAK